MKQIYPSNALILAPLSGFTDLPYRRSARRHGCRYAFTEMIDVAALAHNDNATLDMLRRGEDETFLGYLGTAGCFHGGTVPACAGVVFEYA